MIGWATPRDAATAPLDAGTPPSLFDTGPGFGKLVDAARINYDASSLSTSQEVYRGFYGQQIAAALNAKGARYKDSSGRAKPFAADMFRARGDTDKGAFQVQALEAQRQAWRAIAGIRAQDPTFLEGVHSNEALDAAAIAERKRDFTNSNDTLAQAGSIAGGLANLAGGLRESFADPLQIISMAAGVPATNMLMRGAAAIAPRLFGGQLAASGASQIAMRATVEGVANMGTSAVVLPATADSRAEIGETMDAGDVALELATSFIAGAGLDVVQAGIGASARGLLRANTAMSVRAQRAALRKVADERPLAPDEADALAVLDDVVADIASSPFVPTPAGDAAHSARLSEAVDALENDRPMDAAVFGEPAAPVRDELAAKTRREAVRAYAEDRSAGKLDPQAIADATGMSLDEARAAMMEVASGRYDGQRRRAITMRRRYDPVDPDNPGPRSFTTFFARGMQRQGPVDLLTWIAERGGIADTGGDGLLKRYGRERTTKPKNAWEDPKRSIRSPFVPGAGPLFRKGGMNIDTLGQELIDGGWFPERFGQTIQKATINLADETNGLYTSEVLDLLDRALTGKRKIYHPEDYAAVEARAQADAMADTDMQAAFYEAGDAAITDWWNSPEGQFFTDGEPLTPDMLAEMRMFQTEGASPDEVFGAWSDSRSVAEAEAAYAQAGLADEQALADILEQADAIFGDPGAAATAAGIEPPFGGGPDLVPGDAGTRGEAGGDIGAAVAAAAAAGAAREALAPFDDPAGPGVAAQVESLVHDLRAEIEGEPAVVAADAAMRAPQKDPTAIIAAREAFVAGGGTVGPHGPIHPEWASDFQTAVANLLEAQDGEVPAALSHPEIGAIDLVYGDEKAGLAHIAAKHPDVLPVLPKLLQAMPIVSRTANRVRLENDTYRAIVSLDYFGTAKTWLLTAFEKKGEAPGATKDGPAAPLPPGRTNYSGPEPTVPIAETGAAANPLDLGAAVDPAIAERQRLELELRVQAPKRGPVAQTDMSDTALFGQVDAFPLDDGRVVSKAQLLAEIDADNAALKAMRGCL